MNHVFTNLMTILALNAPVLMIPGANFVLIVRHATDNASHTAFYCALGVTTAIMLHVMLSYYFVGYVLSKFQITFVMLKYIGALYLLYLAIGMLKPKSHQRVESVKQDARKDISSAFLEGFFIDFLNPFVIFFYVSLWATLMGKISSGYEVYCYFFTILIITLSWFVSVSHIFSIHKIRHFLMHNQLIWNRLAGCTFIWFSYRLASAHIG